MSVALVASVLFCVVTLPSFAKPTSKSGSGKASAWVLDQTSDEAGRGECIIAKDGVRIKLKSLTAFVVAPKYDATIFDTSTKKYVELPYEEWSSKYRTRSPNTIQPTGKTETIAGLKSQCYLVPSKKVVKEVWFTTDIPVKEDMCSFIATTMHLPGGKGMPLRMEVIRQSGRGQKVRVFDTLKLTKRDSIDPKTFQKPVGFKKVDSEYQLFVKEDTVKDMGGFLQ